VIPDISIIVCTQNRAAMLRGALASLYDLATDDFTYEIVVIDNASTDDTPRVIAEAARASRHLLRGIHEPEKGIVSARNRGLREARGRWIAFFDDDQLADRAWLQELYRGAQEKNSRVVGGSVHLTFPGGCQRQLAPSVRMLLGEAALGDQPLTYGGRLTPGCGNLMVERGVFDEVGVFRWVLHGRGEDTDLFKRIEQARIAAWYLPGAIVHHVTPAERLADDYLLELSRKMGEGVALRQAAALGCFRFGLLWLAKALRLLLVSYPQCGLAALRGDRETLLGQRCLAEINRAFLQAGCRWQRRASHSMGSPTVVARQPVTSLLPGASAK
jgi:cellulose synthase/poly-beta-1,6-N-acetylglucosamine synthase-like glycosyltransferase